MWAPSQRKPKETINRTGDMLYPYLYVSEDRREQMAIYRIVVKNIMAEELSDGIAWRLETSWTRRQMLRSGAVYNYDRWGMSSVSNNACNIYCSGRANEDFPGVLWLCFSSSVLATSRKWKKQSRFLWSMYHALCYFPKEALEDSLLSIKVAIFLPPPPLCATRQLQLVAVPYAW